MSDRKSHIRMLAKLALCACTVVVGSMIFVPQTAAGPDREKNELGELPPGPEEVTRQRKELLDSLFVRLKQSRDPGTAQVLEQAIWKLWLRSGSDTIDILMQQSERAVRDDRTDVALGILDAVVEIAPDYAEGWNKRATVLYLRQEYEASLRDIDRVLELEPRHFGALSGMGLIKQAQGDEKGALEAFRRALRFHPYLASARQAVKLLSERVEGKGI